MVVIMLNGIYAIAAYNLARHFLSKFFSFVVAILSVIFPHTLLHFTWATEIPANVCFILTLFSFNSLLHWISKPKNIKLLFITILLGTLASLIKETGYAVLASIPIAFVLSYKHQSKITKGENHSFLYKFLPIYLPSFVLITLISIRHYALLVYPQLIDPTSPQTEFSINIVTLRHFWQNFSLAFNSFYSVFTQLYTYLIPQKSIQFPIYSASHFVPLAFLCLIVSLIIYLHKWKNQFFKIFIILDIIALLLFYSLTNVFLVSLLFQYLYSYKLISLGYTLYQYTTYVLLLYLVFYFVKHLQKKYVYLLLFYVTSIVPVLFQALNRLRPVSNTILLIISICIVESFLSSKNKIIQKIGVGLLIYLISALVLFSINTVKFILVENSYLINGERAQIIYSKLRPSIDEDVYRPNNNSIDGPNDCSRGMIGKPHFDLKIKTIDNEQLIVLSSKNHIACITIQASKFRPRKNYKLTFYAKTLTGDFEPDVYVYNVIEPATRIIATQTDDGWIRFTVYFIPLEEKLHIGLYAKGINNNITSIAYKNFNFQGGGIFSYLQYDYKWPKIFSSESLQVPIN